MRKSQKGEKITNESHGSPKLRKQKAKYAFERDF